MKEHTLTINKNDVYEEVAKTTSYAGAKMDDVTAYGRIFTTDEDEEMLERFWNESKNTICGKLKRQFIKEEERDGIYSIGLNLSPQFEDSLLQSMTRSLFSFFVMDITSKWFVFTNKGEAAGYSATAAANLDDIMRKVYFKKRPERPTY